IRSLCYCSVSAESGADSCDPRREARKPRIDVVAKNTHANEHDDRDSRDQQAVLDYILTGFVADEVRQKLHYIHPSSGRSQGTVCGPGLGTNGGDSGGEILEPGLDVQIGRAHV